MWLWTWCEKWERAYSAEHKLAITNTYFRLHNVHRYTWKKSRWNDKIDYILNNKLTTLTTREDVLVQSVTLSIIWWRWQCNWRLRKDKSKSRWYEPWKLRNDECTQQYQVGVSRKFPAASPNCGSDWRTSHLKHLKLRYRRTVTDQRTGLPKTPSSWWRRREKQWESYQMNNGSYEM